MAATSLEAVRIMEANEFCYWLKGYFEISDSTTLTDKQIQMIKQHLDYVFTPKLTPGLSEIKGYC